MLSKTRPAHGTVISADYQTGGRGQIGRTWHSSRGKNLCFSCILFPEISVDEQFNISIAVSLALHEVVSRYTDRQVTIKWPNDIYIDDCKVAGILIHNGVMGQKVTHSVVGVGLNVNEDGFPGELANPISLAEAGSFPGQSGGLTSRLGTLDRWVIFEELLAVIDRCLVDLGRLDRDSYVSRLYGINRVLRYRIVESGDVVLGRVLGVEQDGKLILDVGGERRCFGFREVLMR